ncbi:uncharacterized protein FOMMEDRAFT_162861 [Fomitiporia mediterranea MF3/22]|uniref:Uncharacterized protein n=1 Tax=Fomitiporia mediterranea (strain MF3/22) TaxID=694068 RepID=R7SFS4_FOMME|nr:uncharacterized protein FOMMEDRAFT_162861 [Fomitiporia mediterranea MF3/22]EJC97568.1 hypothetical protein FOMMEDRAFT_162861 [Fomitiporia mediterranea MF3/22]
MAIKKHSKSKKSRRPVVILDRGGSDLTSNIPLGRSSSSTTGPLTRHYNVFLGSKLKALQLQS